MTNTTSIRLAHKIALVTGGSKGIGASIAKHLATAGANVILTYSSSRAGAEKTKAEITARGGKSDILQADFSVEADIIKTYAEIKKRYGKLDIVVNNAGVYSFGPIEDVTAGEFHRQFNLNVLGVLISCREAVKILTPQGGSILNIGSVVGSMPPPSTSIYSATKGAVDNLTISLSKELGARGIRVNSINPGLVATEGTQSAGISDGEFHDRVVQDTPLGRIGTPDDIGPVAIFLSSEEARWITGQRLFVSGGQTL